MQKTKSFFKTIILIILAVLGLVYAKSIKRDIADAIYICLESIIPSLYFFMIVSSLLMKSGLSNAFQKYLSPITKKLFGFDGRIFAVFLFSQIGGYPVGIRLLSDLYTEKAITQKQANIFSCFCYSSGPAFILGIVCNKSQFAPILISNITANLLLAFVLCKINARSIKSEKNTKNINIKSNGADIVACTQSSAKSLFCVCAMILLMRVLICIARNIGLISLLCHLSENLFGMDYTDAYSFWCCFFEVSCVNQISFCFLRAALLSFGGICVIMQIFSLCSFKISFAKFCTARLIAALISGFICLILFDETIQSASTSAMANAYGAKFSINSIYSLLLLLMSCILLTKNSRQTKNNVI